MVCEHCGSRERCRTVHKTRRRPSHAIVIERCAECFAALDPAELIEELEANAPPADRASGPVLKESLRRAIRWRAPRPALRGAEVLRRPRPETTSTKRGPAASVPVLRVGGAAVAAANDAGADEPPPTLPDPTVMTNRAVVEGRPAVFDALCASVEVLAAESVPCELDVVIERGASDRLYRDPDVAARLVSPFVARMPERDGLIAVGTIRVAGRPVRIYERAA